MKKENLVYSLQLLLKCKNFNQSDLTVTDYILSLYIISDTSGIFLHLWESLPLSENSEARREDGQVNRLNALRKCNAGCKYNALWE